MARFFFDSSAGPASFADEIGLDLPDFEAARQHALAGLADLVREEIGKGVTSFAISVHDGAGSEVYLASLAFSERRPAGAPHGSFPGR
jgi:hypothetical protein